MQLHEWQHIVQTRVLDAAFPDDDHRLGIYHNAYRLRLAEALRTNYPALHVSLGDDDFNGLADSYRVAYPSRHPSIRWFGAALPDFLAQQTPYAHTPFLAELARFEWALRHTVDACDAERVTAAALHAVEPERWGALQFDLHPSASLLSFAWNAPALYRALVGDADSEDDNGHDDQPVQPQRQPSRYRVWRNRELSGCWRSIEAAENVALDALRQGKDVGALCELALDLVPGTDETGAAMRIAGWLRQWVDDGILCMRATA